MKPPTPSPRPTPDVPNPAPVNDPPSSGSGTLSRSSLFAHRPAKPTAPAEPVPDPNDPASNTPFPARRLETSRFPDAVQPVEWDKPRPNARSRVSLVSVLLVAGLSVAIGGLLGWLMLNAK